MVHITNGTHLVYICTKSIPTTGCYGDDWWSFYIMMFLFKTKEQLLSTIFLHFLLPNYARVIKQVPGLSAKAIRVLPLRNAHKYIFVQYGKLRRNRDQYIYIRD